LANDDRLRPDFDPVALQMKSRFAAARIAAHNVVAGEPVTLRTDPDSDVRFGRLMNDHATGEKLFVESQDRDANSVAVVARCIEARSSAVPLPFRTFYAPTDADVIAVAEASLNFHVRGLRTVDHLPVPTLPLAVLAQPIPQKETSRKSSSTSFTQSHQAKTASAATAAHTPNWTRDIEQRRGADRFGYDASTGEITRNADGIPEITLRTAAHSSNSSTNAFVIALTGDLTESHLRRQITQGWSGMIWNRWEENCSSTRVR
jgi:hypothetical protein